ncbi:DUF5703 family protein [Pseudokineococcus sp. 1T1Z-3]|uniref:DUF5703 family protein n=1 Tax=Pseudokineococcus sp. 1T1Z-3 TaxID=3132745 RepID=UPI0030B1B928
MDASRRPLDGDDATRRPDQGLQRRGTPRASSYEYREIVLPRGTSRGEARARLTEEAEYGKWELAGVRLYLGGRRRVVLRRRIIRMDRLA